MNELAVIDRNPQNEVQFGQKAAKALMEVVRAQKLARKFGGEKEHLYVEAWQMLGQFAGISAKVDDVSPCEIEGIKGAKAKVSLIDQEGNNVGSGEAYCMRDEANWRNKPWFQVASMAQTRAVGKAFRIKIGWVAAMAGYSGTPAEEMESMERAEPSRPQSAPKPVPKQEPPAEVVLATSQQQTEIIELAGQAGEAMLTILTAYKVNGLAKLTTTQAEKIIARLKGKIEEAINAGEK